MFYRFEYAPHPLKSRMLPANALHHGSLKEKSLKKMCSLKKEAWSHVGLAGSKGAAATPCGTSRRQVLVRFML